MKTNARVPVNNIPNYVDNNKICVARIVDNELWFYGAYDTYEKASEVCDELDEYAVIFVYDLA